MKEDDFLSAANIYPSLGYYGLDDIISYCLRLEIRFVHIQNIMLIAETGEVRINWLTVKWALSWKHSLPKNIRLKRTKNS